MAIAKGDIPKLWNGEGAREEVILFHDQRSTGYDIRDLNLVLKIIENISVEVYFNIVLDLRLEKILLQNIVNKSNVSIVSHDIIRFPIPLEEIIEIAIAQKADHYARFDQLSVTYLYDNNKLISPTGYLDVNPDDVKEHSLYLDSIEIEARKKIQKLKILPLSYLYGKNHMEVNLEERKLDLDS